MKKILLIALGAVALLLGSCTKDNNEITDPVSPITGLEMPASSAEKPITAGEVVTINGKGFTASDGIWLSTATKAADEVKAEGVKLTETGISFTAPAIDGEVSLTLKQNGKVYPLGKMFFSTKSPLQEHIYAVKDDGLGGDQTSEFYEYDLATNALKPVFTHNGGTRMIVADNANIYYVTGPYSKSHLMCYNVKEKKTTQMYDSFDNANWFLGIIDSKLHAIKYDKTTGGFSLASIAADGKHTLVKDFGQLLDPTEIFHRDEYPFVYDPVSKSILLDGGLRRSTEQSYIKEVRLSFSTETRATTGIPNFIRTKGWEIC